MVNTNFYKEFIYLKDIGACTVNDILNISNQNSCENSPKASDSKGKDSSGDSNKFEISEINSNKEGDHYEMHEEESILDTDQNEIGDLPPKSTLKHLYRKKPSKFAIQSLTSEMAKNSLKNHHFEDGFLNVGNKIPGFSSPTSMNISNNHGFSSSTKIDTLLHDSEHT